MLALMTFAVYNGCGGGVGSHYTSRDKPKTHIHAWKRVLVYPYPLL